MSGIFVVGNLVYYVYNGRIVSTTVLSEIRGTTQTAITVECVDFKRISKGRI